MHTLTARRLITDIGEIEYPAITISPEGLIEDISTDVSIRSDVILTAPFLDIHIPGSAGEDVMRASPEGLARMGRLLASRGTANYLATTVTAPLDATLAAVERMADAIEAPTPGDQAKPLGIHLEGPFLSHARRGVHPSELLLPPEIATFDRLQQAARGHIRLLTIAPELPGALDLVRHASASGVRVSLGHTDATFAQATEGIAAGASSATHTFNAMRGLDHREPGTLGAVLDTETLFAELICDGIHVHPAAVSLWLRLKGPGHAILVTDGISATGMGDGEYTLGSLAVTVRGERCSLTFAPQTLAGSVLTLDRAVANLRAFAGCDLVTAVRCASANPARLLGLEATVGSLRPGQAASFNQYNVAGELQATWINGVTVLR